MFIERNINAGIVFDSVYFLYHGTYYLYRFILFNTIDQRFYFQHRHITIIFISLLAETENSETQQNWLEARPKLLSIILAEHKHIQWETDQWNQRRFRNKIVIMHCDAT